MQDLCKNSASFPVNISSSCFFIYSYVLGIYKFNLFISCCVAYMYMYINKYSEVIPTQTLSAHICVFVCFKLNISHYNHLLSRSRH